MNSTAMHFLDVGTYSSYPRFTEKHIRCFAEGYTATRKSVRKLILEILISYPSCWYLETIFQVEKHIPLQLNSKLKTCCLL